MTSKTVITGLDIDLEGISNNPLAKPMTTHFCAHVYVSAEDN